MKRTVIGMGIVLAALVGCGGEPPIVEVKHGAATGDSVGAKFVALSGKQFAQQVPISTGDASHTQDLLGQFAISTGYQMNLLKGTAWDTPDAIDSVGYLHAPFNAWSLGNFGPNIDRATHNDISCELRTITAYSAERPDQNSDFPSWVATWLTGDFPLRFPINGDPNNIAFTMWNATTSGQTVKCHAFFWEWGWRDVRTEVLWYTPGSGWVATRPTNATHMVVRIIIQFPEYGVTNRYYFKFAR